MYENRFFRWVWRFNALAIAVLSFLATVACVWALREIWYEFIRPRPVDSIRSAVQDPAERQEVLTFGAASLNAARTTATLPLESAETFESEGFSSGGKSSYATTVNYLFVDLATGRQRWMFNGNGQVVTLTQTVYPATEIPGVSPQPVAMLVEVVDTDTDGDGRLSRADAKALFLTDADLQGPVEIARGHEALLSSLRRDDGSIDLVLQTGASVTMSRFAVPMGTVLQTIPLMATEGTE